MELEFRDHLGRKLSKDDINKIVSKFWNLPIKNGELLSYSDTFQRDIPDRITWYQLIYTTVVTMKATKIKMKEIYDNLYDRLVNIAKRVSPLYNTDEVKDILDDDESLKLLLHLSDLGIEVIQVPG